MKKELGIFVAVVLLGALGFVLWQQYGAEAPDDSRGDEAAWQEIRFASGRASLRYPAGELEQETEGDIVTLLHHIPYNHFDPCDFRGDAPALTALTDFHVSFEVFDENLASTVRREEAESFLTDYMEGEEFESAEGFIDPFRSGDLNGHQITFGVENCGMYKYYFPLSADQTLVVERKFVTELRDSVMREQTVGLSGVISPEAEQELFEQILETFQIR